MAQLDSVLESERFQRNEAAKSALTLMLQEIYQLLSTFSQQKGLQLVQTGFAVHASSTPPQGETGLALFDSELGPPADIARYTITLRGEDAESAYGGVQIWRDQWLAEGRQEPVIVAAVENYLARKSPSADT